MVRPCFLVIDREFVGSISTRKLVIETAKFNVLTAYSSVEALETLERFPAVDGVVLDAAGLDLSANELAVGLKKLKPRLPIVAVGAPGAAACDAADYQLESFDPTRLIALLRQLVPAEATAVDRREAELAAKARRGES